MGIGIQWRSTARGVGGSALLAVAFTLMAAIFLLPGSARASESIKRFTSTPSLTQAGGHPNVVFIYEWTHRGNEPRSECHCDDPRTIHTHSPTGFIGNPHAIPQCTLTEFSIGDCPEESQVGVVGGPGEVEGPLSGEPVYNMETHPDESGLIAFKATFFKVPIFISLSSRTDSDYGLDSIGSPISRILPFPGIELELWGVPGDPSHDVDRYITPLEAFEFKPKTGAKSNLRTPYLQNPTTCGVPLTSSVDLEYYSGDVLHADSPYPATTGCDQLAFNPSLTLTPTTGQTDTASGVDVDLRVPQNQSATTPSPSEIRSATVTMPLGFSINANAADGKVVCPDAESAIGTLLGATCPEAAKVGTLSIDSSALPGPIPGAIYLSESKPGDRYRLILAADGFGIHVKLVGSVHPDPETGRLVVSFVDLPQSPLTEFSMHFFGSERGLLATPTQCGTYPVQSEFVPWDSVLSTQSSLSFFEIASGPNGLPCPNGARPFSPEVAAGSDNLTAGMHTPFRLRVSRNDGDQNLTGISVTTPPGFAATLKGVRYCPQPSLDQLATAGYLGLSEQAAHACPADSQIGTAVAGVGAGTHPLYVDGRVYLAGPYKGSPLSLVVVIPAVSGPYDLGVVAVRAAISVDPVTAQVTTTSDPFPQIFDGIPLRTRSIQVSLDRPGFAVNPTNCSSFKVNSSISGDEGAQANDSVRFQVANCAELPYAPKLGLKFSGGVKDSVIPRSRLPSQRLRGKPTRTASRWFSQKASS